MKNIIISAASILIVVATASAQGDFAATALPHSQAGLSTGTGTGLYRDVANAERSELKDKTVLFAWTEKGARYRAFFTSRGVWLNTVVSYEEGLLPARVKTLVRRTYNHLRISYVDEVLLPGQNTVYRIQLQDDTKLVIVKVAGDEIEKEAEYRK